MKEAVVFGVVMGISAVLLSIFLYLAPHHSESEQNSKPTTYRYGDLYKIKDGFFKDYACILLVEYDKGVFCKVAFFIENGKRDPLSDSFVVNENFQKSNIELIEE